MFKYVMSFLLGISLCSNVSALSLYDFFPILQAKTDQEKTDLSNVKKPDDVSTTNGIGGQTAVTATSAQDAINAAVKNLEAGGGGAQQIKFPSGFGWVSSGQSVYGVYPNNISTLTAQRNAYQKAYLSAKKNLAEALYGLSSSGKDEFANEMKSVMDNTNALANSSEIVTENITEQVEGMLRGYVIYNVNDEQDKDSGTVTVTIVATPKTMGKGKYIDPSTISAETVADGMNELLAEVSSGLFPPVGGKTITVPKTGEMAFIGYGSAVVVPNPNRAIAKKLAIEAQKMALMRARSALCGVIIGDKVVSSSVLDSVTKEEVKQFEEQQLTDPINNKNQNIAIKLNEQQNSFINSVFTKEQITSMRKGIIPPGVSVNTFFNKEKTLAQAVAIYLPSATANASSFGNEMNSSQLVNNNQPQSNKPNNAQGGSLPTRGASGQVTKVEDL